MRILAVILVALSINCSGPQYVHPECRDGYDECVNLCAYQCDQGVDPLGPEVDEISNTNDTWGSGCQSCLDTCASIARACSDSRESFGGD